MKTGYLMLFQNAHEGLSDAQMVRAEMKISEQIESFGFDFIWSAEPTAKSPAGTSGRSAPRLVPD